MKQESHNNRIRTDIKKPCSFVALLFAAGDAEALALIEFPVIAECGHSYRCLESRLTEGELTIEPITH